MARLHITISLKLSLETAPVEAAKSASSWTSVKAGGARPAIHFMGMGDKAARACKSTAVFFPLQRIFGFGRHPSTQGGSDNCRGRKRVWHTHVHHQWPPKGGTRGGQRAGDHAGSTTGAVSFRLCRRSGRRQQHQGVRGEWVRGARLRRPLRWPLLRRAQRRHCPQRERQLRGVRQRLRPRRWVALLWRKGQVGGEPGFHGG